jgi:hypothetical protein
MNYSNLYCVISTDQNVIKQILDPQLFDYAIDHIRTRTLQNPQGEMTKKLKLFMDASLKRELKALEAKYQCSLADIQCLMTAEETHIAFEQCHILSKVVKFYSKEGISKEALSSAFFLGQMWARLSFMVQVPSLLSASRVSNAGKKGGHAKKAATQVKHQLIREKYIDWKKARPKPSKNKFINEIRDCKQDKNVAFWDRYWDADPEKEPLGITQIKTILKGL